METGKTDKELIEHWLEGDERAFEHLFQRHVHKLYLFTVEQVNDRETAKELVMDVMLRFWQSKESCRDIHSVSAYLYRAVKHAIIDLYRKKARSTSSLEEVYTELLSDKQPDSHLIDNEYRYVLKKGIEQLSPQRRLIFTLKRNNDLSNKEIAEQLSLSVKTVESHMTAAITFLRGYVNREVSWVITLLAAFTTIS